MKIKCPKCQSKLEVESIGDLVSCPYCLLEFTVEQPKPQRSLKSILSKINWLRWLTIGLSLSVVIFLIAAMIFGFWLKSKSPESFHALEGLVSGFGMLVLAACVFTFMVLLVVNIILWIFLPLMVYSIKQKLEEAVVEIKNLKK